MKIFRFVLFFYFFVLPQHGASNSEIRLCWGEKSSITYKRKSEDNNSDLLQELFFR